MRKTFLFLYTLLLAVFCTGVTLIAEEITLTTYYPAPYGAYNELSVSQAESTNNNTSALTVSSTDNDTSAPVISASAKLRGMLLDSNDESALYYILNIRSGVSLTSRLYVRNDGNVGIGTTNPAAVLDVNGTVNATGYSANGIAGYTGDLRDSNHNKIADVKNGIITGVSY